MHRILLATALAAALVGSADAATKNKRHVAAQPSVEVQQPQRFQQYQEFPSRPRWASPQQCFTDDGYGRYTPCEGGGKGY
jgi:hypothetical protein